MNRRLIYCFFLPICFIFFLPGISVSDESKKDIENTASEKAKKENMHGHKSGVIFSWKNKKYSMRTIRPNPHIDSEIIQNNFDPDIDYKLRIIDPYTRKEITGYKGRCFGHFKPGIQLLGKRYETPTNNSGK